MYTKKRISVAALQKNVGRLDPGENQLKNINPRSHEDQKYNQQIFHPGIQQSLKKEREKIIAGYYFIFS